MPREERAKQFMPFSALKGYEEALRKAEEIVVPQKELCLEYEEDLERKIKKLKKEDLVTIIYYYKNKYIKKTGVLSKIDLVSGTVTIVQTKIKFTDIYDIRKDPATI